MTTNHDELPESLCFEADGHVTDVVLTCLADGEAAILPAKAAAHVEACEGCTQRLGVEALLAVNATDALLAASAAPAPLRIVAPLPAAMAMSMAIAPLRDAAVSSLPAPIARKRRPLPLGALAAALVVAVLGALPGWMDTLRDLRTVVPDLLHAVPVWSHALEAVLRSVMRSRGGAAARWMIAATFVVVGSLWARAVSRKQSLKGGLG